MSRSSTTFLRTETLELRGDRASNTWCRKCMPGPVTTNLQYTRGVEKQESAVWLNLHTAVHYPVTQTLAHTCTRVYIGITRLPLYHHLPCFHCAQEFPTLVYYNV